MGYTLAQVRGFMAAIAHEEDRRFTRLAMAVGIGTRAGNAEGKEFDRWMKKLRRAI